MQTMVDTTLHVAAAVLAARRSVSLCYRTTPDACCQVGFPYNLIKKSLTCSFWQVLMETSMSENRLNECQLTAQ